MLNLRHRRNQFSVYITLGIAWKGGVENNASLADHIILRCVIGSRAYGLDEAGSDTDRRGIYLPPADRHWSLAGVPEQLEDDDAQECYWELQKFLTLALKRAFPNSLAPPRGGRGPVWGRG